MRIDVAGLAIVMLLAIGAVWLPLSPVAAPGDYRPLLTFRVTEEQPLDLVIHPDTHEVKLVLVAEPQTDASSLPLARLMYLVDVAWVDTDGSEHGHQRLSVHAGRSSWPAAANATTIATPVLDPRTVLVARPPGASQTLRVRVPEGSEPVRVRAFRDVEATDWLGAGTVVGVDARDALRFARRLGLDSWTEIGALEAGALADRRWEALRPVFGGEFLVEPALTAVVDPTMPAQARRASGQSLLPGRSLAWTLRGPVDAVLLGAAGLEALELSAVVEDVGSAHLAVATVPAPAWARVDEARHLRLDVDAQVSIRVHNAGASEATGLLLLVDAPGNHSLGEGVESAPLSSLLPGAPYSARKTLSVIPPFVYLDAHEPTADAPAHFELSDAPVRDVARVSLRPLRVDPTDPTPQQVRATVVHADGRRVMHTLSVPFEPSTFERIGDPGDVWEQDVWVGEPQDRFVHVGAHAVALEVVPVDGRTLVSVASPGAPHGDRTATSPSDSTRARYARRVHGDWQALSRIDGGVPRLLWANNRFDLLDTHQRAQDAAERTFAQVDASGRGVTPGRIWLVPPAAEDAAGLVYCGVYPGTRARIPLDADALERTGGFVNTVLWAPRGERGPVLDEPWGIHLDGESWHEGRLRSEVTRRRGRHGPLSSVRLDAPLGARLWVRTWLDEGETCVDAHRPRRAVRIAPGASQTFEVPHTLPDHLVLVGAVGHGTGRLRIAIDGEVSPPETTAYTGWTRRRRIVDLPAREGVTGTALDAPWDVLPVRAAAGLRLGPDLAIGTTTITVTNVSADPMEVYVLVETDGPTARRLDIGRVPW